MADFRFRSEPERTRDGFTNEFERHLHLPPTEASEIVSETSAHLDDRITELVARGLRAEQAEASAVTGFGPPRAFARRLSDSFYETSVSRVAFSYGRLLISAGFLVVLAVTVLGAEKFWSSIPEGLFASQASVIGVLVFGALSLPMCAFMARRNHARLIITLGVALTAASGIMSGYSVTRLPTGQFADRRNAVDNRDWNTREIHEVERKLRLLAKGQSFYTAAVDQQPVPNELKVGTRFLVPRLWIGRVHDFFAPTASNEVFVAPRSDGSTWYRDAKTSVATFAEAKIRWDTVASRWIDLSKRQIAWHVRERGYYEAVARDPPRFDPAMIQRQDLEVLPFALFIAIIDFAAAQTGRQVFHLTRNRRRRSAT